MTRKSGFDGLDFAPQWILAFGGAYLIIHLLVIYVWNSAGQAISIQGSSGGTCAFSVTCMAAVGCWLCLLVLRNFPAGSPMRPAWLLFCLAAAAQAVSGVAAQLLGSNWMLNPLQWGGHVRGGTIEQIRRFAVIAGGPVRLALLAAGMLVALRVLRKFGFWVRPSTGDWAISAIIYLYAVARFGEAGAASLAAKPIGFADWVSLAGLPILCVLVLQATLLRQSVTRMGSGLIAKCWLAFMGGIFLTGAGELALWVIPHYTRAWPFEMIEPLIGLPSAALLTLAPAWLVVAQRRAATPSSGPAEDLATSIPALAR
jgi:hypothetical protein